MLLCDTWNIHLVRLTSDISIMAAQKDDFKPDHATTSCVFFNICFSVRSHLVRRGKWFISEGIRVKSRGRTTARGGRGWGGDGGRAWMKGDLRESAGLDFGWMQACTAPPLSIIASQGRCSGGKKKNRGWKADRGFEPLALFSHDVFTHRKASSEHVDFFLYQTRAGRALSQ